MATSILLVTQDSYLVRGIELLFPDIIQLDSIDRKVFDGSADEYSVLIDSRSPLHCYDYLILDASRSKKPVSCIMLDMRYREAEMLNMKLFLRNLLEPTDITALFTLLLNMKSRRLTSVWLENLVLSDAERLMLHLLMTGMTMEEAADMLNMSVRGLYRQRTELSERLGVENFNEACLFIFKNNLLELPGDPRGLDNRRVSSEEGA
ncbi:TPA: helix-turn-helix transcriptional regulator [Kluyvera georgiana]